MIHLALWTASALFLAVIGLQALALLIYLADALLSAIGRYRDALEREGTVVNRPIERALAALTSCSRYTDVGLKWGWRALLVLAPLLILFAVADQNGWIRLGRDNMRADGPPASVSSSSDAGHVVHDDPPPR
jgi:hypothetical protein